jgi:DeoR family transcriptional regulator, aga operon transcriptional repressor
MRRTMIGATAGGRTMSQSVSGEQPRALAQLTTRGRERREQMLAVITDRAFVRVGELSEYFGISEVTVRSDLAALAASGRIRRIRGGAMSGASAGQERPFEEALVSFAAEKLAIGRAAAELIGDGESVLIDVGTTAVAAARALAARAGLRDVVVFTNGLKTALELERAIPQLSLIVLGGMLRPLQHSLVEPLATHMLDHISVSTLLLGCNGVHPIGGITNVNLPEAQVKKRMLEVARRRIVLADGSKIGRIELSHLCPVEEVDLVITGESADPVVVEALRACGCEVEVVG